MILWVVPSKSTVELSEVKAVTPNQLPCKSILAAPVQVRVPTVKLPSTLRVPVEIVMVSELVTLSVTFRISSFIAKVPPVIVRVPITAVVPFANV